MADTISANELFRKLESIKVSGSTCRYSLEKCEQLAPLINEINQVKKEKNALVLAHSYVSPEIVYGVADYVGDSYYLSKMARDSEAQFIVFAAVKFMAETAKILSPRKIVVIPGRDNGCTLADSITSEQVSTLRSAHPDFTFVCYINTTADVKAECDVCVTSSNVYEIVKKIPNRNIYFLPDRLMGQNLANEMARQGVDKVIKFSDGTCYVHEEYDPDMIEYVKSQYPGIEVISHPECKPEILAESNFVGSTTQLIDYVAQSAHNDFFVLTECGLTSRIQAEYPDKRLVGTCTMCRFMKSNTLENIRDSLINPTPDQIITLDDLVIEKARRCVDRMFEFTA